MTQINIRDILKFYLLSLKIDKKKYIYIIYDTET